MKTLEMIDTNMLMMHGLMDNPESGPNGNGSSKVGAKAQKH